MNVGADFVDWALLLETVDWGIGEAVRETGWAGGENEVGMAIVDENAVVTDRDLA